MCGANEQIGETTMEQPTVAFSAIFIESNGGYVGFIEELPGINSYGRSVDEARTLLAELTQVVFDEERRASEELLAGKEVLREQLLLTLARGS
jgi:predicted RNase H-like HicB family nuclease